MLFALQADDKILSRGLPLLRLLLQMDVFQAGAPLHGQRSPLVEQRQPFFQILQAFPFELEFGAMLLQHRA